MGGQKSEIGEPAAKKRRSKSIRQLSIMESNLSQNGIKKLSLDTNLVALRTLRRCARLMRMESLKQPHLPILFLLLPCPVGNDRFVNKTFGKCSKIRRRHRSKSLAV